MFEKVNMSHPDKLADRIAGALVDLTYKKAKEHGEDNPRCAFEVLLGHGICTIIGECSETITEEEAFAIVSRIVGRVTETRCKFVLQDINLAKNQRRGIRCGDNGIFKGYPVSLEQRTLSNFARKLYEEFPFDGKFIINRWNLIICQSHAKNSAIKEFLKKMSLGDVTALINPIGEWTGGQDVDSGATNRKLGSDMGDGVTGGGLHGKDLSKADVSVNIWCHLNAQEQNREFNACCAIGDNTVNGIPYTSIVETAREYIKKVGGFEKFAEWGLI